MYCSKKKMVTFSFDDGIEDDIRLIAILNKYGLKATFNLNAGHLTNAMGWEYQGLKRVRYLNYFQHPQLYRGHEIACHGYSHPHLEKLDPVTVDNEVRLDKKILEMLFGCRIQGMAYPFGTYNDEVIRILRDNGIRYCRTVHSTYGFDLPQEPLTWHPTCHFKDERRMELAKTFVEAEPDGQMLFYIWGHSYELVTEEDWEAFSDFCGFLANREDICYCTNQEVLEG